MRSRRGSRHGCRCGRLLAICGKVGLQGAGLSGLPSGSGGNPRTMEMKKTMEMKMMKKTTEMKKTTKTILQFVVLNDWQ